MRIKHQVLLLVSKDDDEKLIEFKRSEAVTTTSIRSDCTTIIHGDIAVPADTDDMEIPVDPITTGRFLYLESDRAITVKLGDETVGRLIASGTGCTAKVVLDGQFTSVKISNADETNAANISYVIGGTVEVTP